MKLCPHFLHFCVTSIKFSTDVQKNLLCGCGFHKIQHNESHVILGSVNELLSVLSTFHCPKNWKLTGAIPDRVTWIFHRLNPSGCAMVPGLTQPLP
jgi:hypothetical protein